eukprot:Polyplicarium_translucidae@DN5673_c0_g1_i1.p1
MKRDVAAYISACLPCKRAHVFPRRSLRGSLERPHPFETVSLDHVGPRDWMGAEVHYLCIIDHASRFMVSVVVPGLTAKVTVSVFHEHWVAKFGAPTAVLTDGGPAFTSHIFRAYVLQHLGAFKVTTSPSYPKGNAINEASHKGIEATLRARAQYDQDPPFTQALQEAVLAYNAPPH